MSSLPRRPFYIAGSKTSSNDYWEIRQPGEAEPFALVAKAASSHAEQAIAEAVKAFAVCRKLSTLERKTILSKAADTVKKEADRMALDLSREAGKPISLAKGEVARCELTLRNCAEEAGKLGGETLNLDVTPDAEGVMAFTRNEPIGPVSAITPFNFPLNLVAHKLGPAVAAGCPIVLKPSENTPLSALNLAQIIINAGWPPEALSIVTCPVAEAGQLVTDERLKLLTFTGSAEVGWQLKQQAGRKRVALELGGNAAVIIDETAELDRAARRCAAGGFAYAGQSCISVQRIYVHWQVKKDFLRLLMEETQRIRCGDIADEAVLVGPLINEEAAERVERWIEEARTQGAHVLTGGSRDGLMLQPAIITQTSPEMKISCREVFAPVVVVDGFNSWEDALEKANDTVYGLQAGVFTNTLSHARQAIEELEYGAVLINEIPTFRVDPQPYGGIKQSGMGKEGPRYAIEEMTEEKLVMIR